tara:strand:+ start:7288 stop:7752 length:465 start_codon:yes stop_codon:yes gene_type:complete
MRIEVRESRDDEFYRIVELAHGIKEESRYSPYDLNIEKIKSYFDMQTQGNFKVFFALHPEKDLEHTVGFGAYHLHPHYFSDVLVSSDMMTYVHPLYRGSSAFFRLVKAYEKWAISKGVKEINLATSTGVDPLKTSDMYIRLGYPMSGLTHTKVL